MAKRRGDLSRRELLARTVALGGVAMAGPSGTLFGQEAQPKSALPSHAAKPLTEFGAHLRGTLITPADPAYDDARKLWNGMIDKRPAAIVRCAGTSDVVRAIEFARNHDLAVSVRGGGHNVAGKALGDGALAIDLSPMKGVRVDPVAKAARAEGGVIWNELDRETLTFELVTTGGTMSTTGIAGLTLGGGIGWLMRKHGLACDNLLSVDVVTADGRFLTANESQNADLFWAVRGGGGNFGVVTSLEYRLHDLEPITAGIAYYPAAKAGEVLRFYREFTRSAPDSLVTMAGISNGPGGSPLAGQKAPWIAVCHSGPAGEGERVVRPIQEFGPPVIDTTGPMAYRALQTQIDSAYPPGNRNYWRSNFLRGIGDEAIDAIVSRSGGLPDHPGSTLFFEHMQGAVGRVGTQDTAFSHRTATHDFTILSVWEDSRHDDRIIKWTREFGNAMESVSTGAGYVNYMTDDEGAERVKAAYDANYERLVAIKRKYDPTNVFSGNQNIAP